MKPCWLSAENDICFLFFIRAHGVSLSLVCKWQRILRFHFWGLGTPVRQSKSRTAKFRGVATKTTHGYFGVLQSGSEECCQTTQKSQPLGGSVLEDTVRAPPFVGLAEQVTEACNKVVHFKWTDDVRGHHKFKAGTSGGTRH